VKLRVAGPLTGQSNVCEPILRALPDWFGLEASTQAYITQTDRLPTFVAIMDDATVGFLTLKQHSDAAAEIVVMGVLPRHHRHGIGRALVERAQDICAAPGPASYRSRRSAHGIRTHTMRGRVSSTRRWAS